MKERACAWKQVLKSKQVYEKNNFITLQNKVTKELRKAKTNFFICIITEANQLIWKQIQKLTGTSHLRCSKRLELKICGKLVQDPEEQARAFNEFLLIPLQRLHRPFLTYARIPFQ